MNCQHFECGYINKPYTNLRPFSCFTPCPKFSCPQFNTLPNCGCFPNLNQNLWNPNFCHCNPNFSCIPNFNCNQNFCHCNPINCMPQLFPRDLLFFFGGYSSRKHRHEPCMDR